MDVFFLARTFPLALISFRHCEEAAFQAGNEAILNLAKGFSILSGIASLRSQ